jgi:hypothetical protein
VTLCRQGGDAAPPADPGGRPSMVIALLAVLRVHLAVVVVFSSCEGAI